MAVTDDEQPARCAWVESGDYRAESDGNLPVVSDFQERYCGEWESFDDYAQQLADDNGLLAEVSDDVARYFDRKSWSADQAHDYNVCRSDSGVYVSRSF